GGAEIFNHALPLADRVYLTRVHADVPGDVRFPPLDPRGWRLIESLRHEADGKNEYAYSFKVYERIIDVCIPNEPARV
ncbi:MAG: dihydrofolate reductase, partial [Rhodoplanes sp.]